MTTKKLLFGILLAAAILRLAGLGSGDLIGSDEIFYGVRAIGMLDYDNAPKQSTPLEWFDPINRQNHIIPHPADLSLEGGIPLWTKLSFHDHPPLVFLAQHFSMQIFGENKFAFRLPSALAGILTVYLLYLLGKRLTSEKASLAESRRAGLFSAAIAAVTVNSVHNSRLGLQEPILILLMLATVYFFTLAKDNKKHLLTTGIFAGLAMLAKYNAIILAPIFFTYILLFRRGWLKEKNLWLGILLAIAVFSPVIIYNLGLYNATSHFDFQLSYLLGQNVEVWQSAPGKENAGTLFNKMTAIVPNLAKFNSWPFLLISVAGLCWLTYRALKKDQPATFLLIINGFLFLLIVVAIGPASRFLAMLTPFLALAAGNLLSQARLSAKPVITILVIFLAWELTYTTNTDILNYPVGPKHFAWSRLRYENYRWGYNQLDDYLEKELGGKFPAFVLNQKYQFLDKIIDRDITQRKRLGDQPYSALFIYDDNLRDSARFWSLDRLQIYHGWPVIKAEGFAELQKFELPPRTTYFIAPTDKVLVREGARLTTDGPALEQSLLKKGLSPIEIKNPKGEVAFKVYKF
ncbi:MAG: glycosyltransferase family 39 protein [bacterium]|nr:glycosyltransferase family 39 protein [bacterium]